MLLLAAIARFLPLPETQPSQGLQHANPALGHVALAIIALIYVLLSAWPA